MTTGTSVINRSTPHGLDCFNIDPARFIQKSVRIDPSTMLRTKGLVEM